MSYFLYLTAELQEHLNSKTYLDGIQVDDRIKWSVVRSYTGQGAGEMSSALFKTFFRIDTSWISSGLLA